MSPFQILLLLGALDQTLLPAISPLVTVSYVTDTLSIIQKSANPDIGHFIRLSSSRTPIVILSPSGGEAFSPHGDYINAYRMLKDQSASLGVNLRIGNGSSDIRGEERKVGCLTLRGAK